jgi:hypothetical protein
MLGGESLDKSFTVTRPGGLVASISGSPDYRTGKEIGLDLFRSLLFGAVGFGGVTSSGTVFKITSTGTPTTLYSFCAQSS